MIALPVTPAALVKPLAAPIVAFPVPLETSVPVKLAEFAEVAVRFALLLLKSAMKFGVAFWACATQTKEASGKKQSVILSRRGGFALTQVTAFSGNQNNLRSVVFMFAG